MLNHDHQGHPPDQNRSRSITPRNREADSNLRCRVFNSTQMLTSPSLRMTQPNTRGRFHYGKNLSNSMPGITFNHPQNVQFMNHNYQITLNIGKSHHTMTFRTTNILNDPLMVIFPHELHNNHLHNPNITLNYPEAAPVEHMKYMDNKASLLASEMVNQPII